MSTHVAWHENLRLGKLSLKVKKKEVKSSNFYTYVTQCFFFQIFNVVLSLLLFLFGEKSSKGDIVFGIWNFFHVFF
jgi:hypothetical protein